MEIEKLPVASQPNLIVSPHPLSAAIDRDLLYNNFLQGESLGTYLDRLDLMPAIPENFVITVSGKRVSFDDVYEVFPKTGDLVVMRARLHGGGDDNKALRTVLMIAVLVLSQGTAVGGWAAVMGAGAYGPAIVLIGGMLLIGALVPVKIPSFDETTPSSTYSLSGGSNQVRPYEPLPLVFGVVRMYPDHGAKPFTEYDHRDQILIQVFNFGLSDVSYTDMQIGDTSLSVYEGPNDGDVILEESVDFTGVLNNYHGNVDTLPGADLIGNAGVFVERTTSINTTKIGIDISGLNYFVGREEGLTFARIFIICEYSVASSGVWLPFFYDSGGADTNTLSIINGDKELMRIGKTRIVSKGQYDVRVKLVDTADIVYYSTVCDYDENSGATNCVETVVYSPRGLNNFGMVQAISFDQLKSYQPDESDYTNQKRLCMSIKANAQLNGRVDIFNVIASAKVLVWTDPTWTNQVSSNPGWQFLSLAKGKFDGTRRIYGAGLADARIDVEKIKSWATWCTDKGLECNIVFDAKMALSDMLNTIARCGRATSTWANGVLGVVYDEANLPVTAMFGMSNIIKGTFQVTYITGSQVDEVILAFSNPNIDWQRDTVRVTVPGVTDPVNSVTIEIPGITSELQAGREANMIAAEQFYRRRIMTWETDMEGLSVQRGEVAALSHDVTQWGYSGRLISGTVTTLVLDREVPFTPNTQHYVRVKYPDGTWELVDVDYTESINLINYPEDFDNVYWTKKDIVVIPNNTNAPDGTMAADKIAANSSPDYSAMYTTENVAVGVVAYSLYIKAGEYTKAKLLLWNSIDASRGVTEFDLELGTVHSGTGSIESIGDGWYRCAIFGTNTTGEELPHVYSLDDSWSSYYVGDSFDGIYVWGAMLTEGVTLEDYFNSTDVLQLITPLSTAPDDDVDNDVMDYIWFFAPLATPEKLVKVTDVVPISEDRVRITATDEEDDYYLAEDTGYTYVTPGSFITGIPIISGLTLGETLINVGIDVASQVNVSWLVSGEYGGAFIRAGDQDTPMRDVGRTLDTSFKFTWPVHKTITVEVVCHNLSFESSDVSKATSTILLLGKGAPPADVQAFTVTQVETGFLLEWARNIDIDILEYEIRLGDWVNNVLFDTVRTTSLLYPNPPVGSNTYSIKAIDTTGNYSTNEAIVTHEVLYPANILDFSAAVVSGSVLLAWSSSATAYPLAGYEIREGTVWATSTLITKTLATSYNVDISLSGTKYYLIKAYDIHGNYSVTEGAVNISIVIPGTPVVQLYYDGANAVLTWDASAGSFPIDYYEISDGTGIIAEIKTTTYQVVVTWLTEDFSVVAYDVNGIDSLPGTVSSVIVPPSVANLTAEIIDNNVLLRWDDPLEEAIAGYPERTLPLKAYEIRRGDVFATATVLQNIKGTFATFFEVEAATYKYWVVGIDTADNHGSEVSITANVDQPPDYVLNVNWLSTFSGIKTNCIVTDTGGGLLAIVNTTETFEDHFINNSWTTPQDQIDAGYAYYIEPSQATGSYVEEFDYGTELASTLIKIILDNTVIDGNLTITPNIKIKLLPGDAWTDVGDVFIAYGTAFRYVKITLTFTSTGGDDITLINKMNVILDSKLKNDGGSDTVVTAATGKLVTFNVDFIDITSITVSPNTTSNVTAIFDFVDDPNPTSFTVYLLNPADGTKLTGDFSWSARGY